MPSEADRNGSMSEMRTTFVEPWEEAMISEGGVSEVSEYSIMPTDTEEKHPKHRQKNRNGFRSSLIHRARRFPANQLQIWLIFIATYSREGI